MKSVYCAVRTKAACASYVKGSISRDVNVSRGVRWDGACPLTLPISVKDEGGGG